MFDDSVSFRLLLRAVAEDIAPLVIITGSGMSAPAGLPTWAQLRNHVQRNLESEFKYRSNHSDNENSNTYYRAKETEDYWLFFKLAREYITNPAFNNIIREKLDPKDVEIPGIYQEICSLKPRGLVTLNLDRFAPQAMAATYPGEYTPVIIGQEIARKWHTLGSELPWIVQLHGTIDDSQTWILDTDQRDKLINSESHKLFLGKLFMDFTVLFVGVSADDIAFSKNLIGLRNANFEPSRLFWLTNRSGDRVQKWCSNNNVHLIQYNALDSLEHQKAIEYLVAELKTHKSKDDAPLPPQINKSTDANSLIDEHPSPEEIAKSDPDDARKILTSILEQRISAADPDQVYEVFSEFLREFDYPIKSQAFYVGDNEKGRKFFDYTINFPKLGEGNFGQVYSATDPDGRLVAIKIMRDEIVSNKDMLGGFRRGSASMNILKDQKVLGVSKIIDTFEMPPTIVMENVPGNSLEEIFSSMGKISWTTKLRIIRDVCDIVNHCHKLPNFVLHRDIKPSNIMIKNFDYTTYDDYDELVVLDFDMSWHKGSKEKDIIFESRDDFGYLSPEQTDVNSSYSARSARVDTYGLGMTAYSIFDESHPIPNMPLSSNWVERVQSASKNRYNRELLCLPKKLSRTIYECTKYEQSDRLEFGLMHSRIQNIFSAVSNDVVSIGIFCEELLARLADGLNYSWDDTYDVGDVNFPSGTFFCIRSDVPNSQIEIRIEHQSAGHHKYDVLKSRINKADELLCELFKEPGFYRDSHDVKSDMYKFGGRMDYVDKNSRFDLVEKISNCIEPIRSVH